MQSTTLHFNLWIINFGLCTSFDSMYKTKKNELDLVMAWKHVSRPIVFQSYKWRHFKYIFRKDSIVSMSSISIIQVRGRCLVVQKWSVTKFDYIMNSTTKTKINKKWTKTNSKFSQDFTLRVAFGKLFRSTWYRHFFYIKCSKLLVFNSTLLHRGQIFFLEYSSLKISKCMRGMFANYLLTFSF